MDICGPQGQAVTQWPERPFLFWAQPWPCLPKESPMAPGVLATVTDFHLCPDAFPTSLTPSTSIVFQNNSLSCSSSSRLSPPPLRPFPLQCPHAFLGGAALEAPARTPGASVRAPSPCHHWMACFYPQWMMRTRFHHCSQGPALWRWVNKWTN